MRFRKKPIVIEALQFRTNNDDGTQIREVVRWINSHVAGSIASHDYTSIFIPTLEGLMRADVGDWIIKGIQGEVYPCKPDIFEAEYELVQDEPGL